VKGPSRQVIDAGLRVTVTPSIPGTEDLQVAHPQSSDPDHGSATAGQEYADRLSRLATARWKTWLDVQRPYRWNIRRLNLGRVLDIGCGIGRNLAHLDGNAVGIDHNETSVKTARDRGLVAFTPAEFRDSRYDVEDGFDALLLAHVVEHVSYEVGLHLLREYLPLLRPGGRVVLICPQERGWATDATHVRFVDFDDLARLIRDAGLQHERQYSFPFPRVAGRVFPYNEFVVVARKP
jgi:SAM-dependent methyltransferase